LGRETSKEILEARAKMAEQYGNVKLGGKGTQRKTKFVVHRSNAVQDKKISSIIKKTQARKIPDIQEINIFKDDNSVIHFKKPVLEYSVKEKVTFVTGAPENKTIKDLLPGIMKQLGAKQFSFIKEYADQLKRNNDIKGDKKVDEAPELVENFEDVSKQD
jgi:nascent polypeptide-associated complex subunit beta